MPRGLQAALLVLLGVGAVLTVLVVVRTAVRRNDRIPIFVLLGALLCVAYEPIGDMLVLAYYPENGQVTWVTLFGRGIPVFIGLMYICYIAPFVLVFEHLQRRGFTTRSWWSLWSGTAGGIIVIEVAVMRIGRAWVYYGPQRLVFADLPLWTPITYASFLLAIAAGVHGLAARPRRDHWLIIPAVPALLIAAHVTTSLPAAAAIYSSSNPSVILWGALGTIVVSIVLTHALGRFFVLGSVGRGQDEVVGARGV